MPLYHNNTHTDIHTNPVKNAFYFTSYIHVYITYFMTGLWQVNCKLLLVMC